MRTDVMPEISVILPVYNGEYYLRDTLECIYASNFKSLEVIIVNDGSSDGSEQICMEYLKKYDNIQYFVKENAGVASARNFGLDKARGRAICFVDQDDLFSDNHFSQLYYDLVNNKCDCVISSIKKFANGKRIPFQTVHNSKVLSQQEINNLLMGFVAGNVYKNISEPEIGWTVWNCIYLRDFLNKHRIRFKSFVSYEDDWIFNIEVLNCAKRVYTEQRATYYWRENEKSESHKFPYKENLYKKQIDLFNYLKEKLENVSNDLKLQKNFQLDMFTRLLLSAFYNESMYSNVNKTQIVVNQILDEWKSIYGNIIIKQAKKQMYNKYAHANGVMKKCYGVDYKFFKLLVCGHYKFAYYLNRHCKKIYYGSLVI